ncbi:hypothetical protein [Mycolicibacterium cosmeticum]|uniref:hypothetical protein n=1 Tax=Mycolicibacterium cosmeticum TaxID=258533 RepID=UPI003204E269
MLRNTCAFSHDSLVARGRPDGRCAPADGIAGIGHPDRKTQFPAGAKQVHEFTVPARSSTA